eukprot:749722-Hanusia_phi.AAC.4
MSVETDTGAGALNLACIIGRVADSFAEGIDLHALAAGALLDSVEAAMVNVLLQTLLAIWRTNNMRTIKPSPEVRRPGTWDLV